MARRVGVRVGAGALAALAALALSACGDTLQTKSVQETDLDYAASEPAFPVYWLGRSFEGLPVTTVDRDPGGAYLIAYGNCVVGGQDTCVTPLLVITSPDNSFLPGGVAGRALVRVRGRMAALAQGGRTIQLATGVVVVSIFAQTPTLARAAAQLIDPINQRGSLGRDLPPPLPDTQFDQVPIGEGSSSDQPGAGNSLSRASSRFGAPIAPPNGGGH